MSENSQLDGREVDLEVALKDTVGAQMGTLISCVPGEPALRILSRKEIVELRRQRTEGKVPFRTLAKGFGISVWTAHKLCGNCRASGQL